MSYHISYQWATTSPTNEPPHLLSMSHHISHQWCTSITYPSNEPPLLQLMSHHISYQWYTTSTTPTMSHHISYQGYHHISLILLFTYLYLVICFCSWLCRRVGQVFVCLCKLEIEWNIYIYGGGDTSRPAENYIILVIYFGQQNRIFGNPYGKITL